MIEDATPVGLLQPGCDRPGIVFISGSVSSWEAPLVQGRVDLGDYRFPLWYLEAVEWPEVMLFLPLDCKSPA